METKTFCLKNVALYTKGQYERSGDIWADLKKCLEADGFQPFDRGDIKRIIVDYVTPVLKPFVQSNHVYLVITLLNEIHPSECWKVGYFTKDHTWVRKPLINEYDMDTAVIYWYMSYLRFTEMKELGDIGNPDPKVLPTKKN